jgi:ectoine hydroxylase-related dioxygenase (phytanoyl-CoA dioxygenase family)
MKMNSDRLNAEQLTQYQRDGILRLTLPPASRKLLNDFLDEVCIWLKCFCDIQLTASDLAMEIPKIAARDRKLIGRLYKCSRRFPSIKRLASDSWLEGISAKLMDTTLASCCHFVSVRIDLPSEDKYLLPPHQDFPYIQESMNGVTWWIPFMDMPINVGPPAFIYGSHKSGVLRVKEYDYERTDQSGGKSFNINDFTQIKGESYAENSPVYFGEALVFNTLLVHRSEPNLSSVARINGQVRFGDLLSKDSFDRNYPEGLYLGDSFSKSYPEHVANE